MNSFALFGLWVRPDKRIRKANWRQKIRTWQGIQMAYDLAFDFYPRLIGLTRQTGLHKVHLRLGYEYAGRLPAMCDGETLYSYSLSRDMWKHRGEKPQLANGALH